MAAPVSAVMITHQSDRRLREVLQSLDWCSEVVIVDSGSTDQTALIVSEANSSKRSVRLLQRPFDDFSKQKQFSVDQASHDWVLVIDSDEVVSEELKQEITENVLTSTSEFFGYEIPRVLYFLGKKVSHGGGTDAPLRLFNRRKGRFNGAPVHEKVIVDGRVGRLNATLRHYSYDHLNEYFKKFSRYTTVAAQELHQKRKGVSLLKILSKLVFSFPSQFIKLYVLKLGILDGVSGFLWCFFSALSPVVKYWKLLRLRFLGE